MLYLIIGAFAAVLIGLAIYSVISTKPEKPKDGVPPSDRYPLW